MNKELEIRAAKALGWTYVPCTDGCTKDHHGGFEHGEGDDYDYHSKQDLKFTTSYDWAMLGVKELLKDADLDCYHSFDHALCNILNLNLYELTPLEVMQATPAQITTAWLEVLEAASD